MDSAPSFSLGLTQIQSTSNEIDVSGFVLGDFDYKDVGFCENRSKYRNNPTIMKKLGDAASVKGKKTVVASSKGMKYVFKTVPPHPLRFGISSNRNFVTDVEYYVGKKVLNMFKETCFGVFVDMPKSNFQALSLNSNGNFHWVLAVISLKKRCIRVCDSMLSSQPREPSHEIKRLSVMLPTYISYSGLLENTERTVWSSLEAYKDKMSKVAGDLNDTPFDVKYVEDIAQQVSGSLDCGVFVASYAEFLSDQMQNPSSNLDAEYL
ncbi:hypothetical protein FXO37_22358 [Capsicum annuum]|nr:hypothetical protein FXO37_22358 [Capsicum annuum]